MGCSPSPLPSSRPSAFRWKWPGLTAVSPDSSGASPTLPAHDGDALIPDEAGHLSSPRLSSVNGEPCFAQKDTPECVSAESTCDVILSCHSPVGTPC